MPAGRPRLYESVEEMQEVIDDYFDNHAYIDMGDAKIFAPTVEGLAYHLGMTRETLNQYKGKPEFSDAIKRARQRIGIALEQRLYGNNVTGIIFNLKNNFGWKDKTEQDINAVVRVKDVSEMTDEEIQKELSKYE